MSWLEPLVERRQGLTRRSRILILIGGTALVLLTVNTLYLRSSNSATVDRFPNFFSYRPDPNFGFGAPYDGEPILSNNTSAVSCAWADVDEVSTRKIREKAAPAFPLLSAWLKPEAGELCSVCECLFIHLSKKKARYGPALEKIPPTLMEQFSLGGRIRFQEFFFDQARNTCPAISYR